MGFAADLMIKLKRVLIAPFPLFHPNRYRQSFCSIKDSAPKRHMLAQGGKLHMQDDDFDI